MDALHIDRRRYEKQEEKEVVVSYTGIYRYISNTGLHYRKPLRNIQILFL
jgi:transposase